MCKLLFIAAVWRLKINYNKLTYFFKSVSLVVEVWNHRVFAYGCRSGTVNFLSKHQFISDTDSKQYREIFYHHLHSSCCYSFWQHYRNLLLKFIVFMVKTCRPGLVGINHSLKDKQHSMMNNEEVLLHVNTQPPRSLSDTCLKVFDGIALDTT